MVKPKAVVLLSRGLDPTTVLAKSREQDFDPYGLTLRYGQRHEAEIDATRQIGAAQFVAQQLVVDIDLRLLGLGIGRLDSLCRAEGFVFLSSTGDERRISDAAKVAQEFVHTALRIPCQYVRRRFTRSHRLLQAQP